MRKKQLGKKEREPKHYVKKEEIRKVLNGLGLAILSTPKGILTDTEARKQNVGGELLCEVY